MNPLLQGRRPEIHGHCDRAFDAVRQAFAANFFERDEIGGGVCVLVDGRTVVDLWCGFADPERNQPWARDTLVCSFSVAKAVCATLGHRLVDQGKLDLDAPVAATWPEFAQHGKAAIPVRYLFDHRAALAYLDRKLAPGDLYDWDLMVDALACSRPNDPPGDHECYLNMTFGYLLGELIRRITGRRLKQALAEDLSGPLDLDWHFAVDDADLPRLARLIQRQPRALFDLVRDQPDSLFARSMQGFGADEDFDSLAWRKAEVGSGTLHGSARSMARLFACLAGGGTLDGIRILSPASARTAITEQVRGHDPILDVDIRFPLGYELNNPPAHPMGPNPDAFGHWGAGGAFGFGDSEGNLGFGYSPNFMHPALELGPRGSALVEATLSCL
jgi:CubicO group peptidase (beta-lactamase class C family)